MLISRAEQGFVISNFVKTSGCKTPIFPIGIPWQIISAHLPGKNAGSTKIY